MTLLGAKFPAVERRALNLVLYEPFKFYHIAESQILGVKYFMSVQLVSFMLSLHTIIDLLKLC